MDKGALKTPLIYLITFSMIQLFNTMDDFNETMHHLTSAITLFSVHGR